MATTLPDATVLGHRWCTGSTNPATMGTRRFFLAVHNGVRAHHWRFGDMPPVDGVGDEQIETIIAYVRTLQRANGIE